MSIKRKITLLFIVIVFINAILSFVIENINSEKNRNLTVNNYLNASKKLTKLIMEKSKKIKSVAKSYNLKIISDIKIKNKIKSLPITFGEIAIYKNDNYLYLKIDYFEDSYIFFDNNQKEYLKEQKFIIFLIVFEIFILIIIYFSLLKILNPINRLSLLLERFAKGDFKVKMPEFKDLEIKRVSKSFNKMAIELENSFKERENLLKYIGHELNTPLSKAKFALENGDYTLLNDMLSDMKHLIEEILNLHMLEKKRFKITSFSAETLILESLNKLYIKNEDSIDIEIENFEIKADLEYMAVALKNLIDNALKYSDKLPIKIYAKDNKISVINYAKALKKDFSYYLEAFIKEDSSSEGFGLGLSIVKKIMDKHNFKLTYTHKSGKNIFTLHLFSKE